MQDFYIIKKSSKYFAHLNYTTRPVIFAFRKQKNVEIVRDSLCNHSKFMIDDHNVDTYKITYEKPIEKNRRMKLYEVERMGYVDLNLHVSLNNIDVYIVDNIIEDDEANMYLMNCETKLEPLFINEMMVKIHLNKILNKETVKEG